MATKKTTPTAPTTAIFYASEFCGPCQDAKEMLKKDAALAAAITVIKTDTKRGNAAAEKAGIEVVPTFIRADGKRIEGVPSAARLRKFLGVGT